MRCELVTNTGLTRAYWNPFFHDFGRDLMKVSMSSYRWTRNLLFSLMACIATLFFVSSGSAQLAGTGSIQGTVADSTGAIIPNAVVTITNTSTQVKRSFTTGASGVYTFPNIDIGTYTVGVSVPGFKTYQKAGIVLEVGSNISVDVKMTIGSEEQKVEVKADGLALQTSDVSFKQTIDQQTLTEMPINGRQMTSLITLSGGSSPAPAGDFTGSKYSYQTISVSIAGGGGNTTMWRLDGGDNTDYMSNSNLPFPFPDAVSQFSVESTVLGAQDGMHSGGLVNVVTRSGTNKYHGSVFEFIRNNYIDATRFFSTSKDVLHQNQYGGTFGGRIIKDKLFAFAGYQHTRITQASATTQAHVPTAANLAGDFSVTAGPNCTTSSTNQLVDPLTGVPLPGNKYASVPTFSPAALALQKYLPAIDPAVDVLGCGLVSYSIPSNTSDNQFVTRVDYTIGAKNNLYGRYFVDGYQSPAPYSPTNILLTTQSGNVERVQSFTLGENYVVNSKIVNSAHATLLRRANRRGYSSSAINASAIGVNLYQGQDQGLQLGTGKFSIGGAANSVAVFNDNTLVLEDEVTMLWGKHQIVFGGAFSRNQLNISNANASNGAFSFNANRSAYGPSGTRPVGAPAQLGDASLDFLRGTLNSFQQSAKAQNALRASLPSLYVQDTFHASKQLTLVAGLRWSPQYMPVDYFNRGSVFSMDAFLAGQTSTVYPAAPAGTFFYGDKGVPATFTKNSPLQFSPNIGATYDPFGRGKTVFRGGGELIYDSVNAYTGQRVNLNPPFSPIISQQQVSPTAPMSFDSPWSVGLITSSPFPQPVVPTPSQALFYPQSQYVFYPDHFHPSYTIQWTASVQQEFGHDWQFQMNYIGNHTVHAPIGIALSPAVYIPGVWGPGGTGCAGIVRTGPAAVTPGAPGTACSTTTNQTSRSALTIANPAQGNQYVGGGAGSLIASDIAGANYHGLVTSIQHRLSSTFSLMANHTWSKCLNEADANGDLTLTRVENPNNIRMDYGPCGSDYRHVENIVLVTRSHFPLSSRIKSLLLNGWEFAPLIHIMSGAPYTVTAGQDNSLTNIGNDRPNLVPGVPVYLHTTIRSGQGAANRGLLNPAAFSQIPSSAFGTYGNIGRNSFRGPTSYQFDAQVSRVFPIHEELNATFRLEAFNVLNHPNFSVPSAGLTSTTFGQTSSTGAARIFQGSVKLSF